LFVKTHETRNEKKGKTKKNLFSPTTKKEPKPNRDPHSKRGRRGPKIKNKKFGAAKKKIRKECKLCFFFQTERKNHTVNNHAQFLFFLPTTNSPPQRKKTHRPGPFPEGGLVPQGASLW